MVTKEAAGQAQQTEIGMLESRLKAVGSQDGNPMGVSVGCFGRARAFSALNIPGAAFNTVKGMGTSDLPHLEHIMEFYRKRTIPARFELSPLDADEQLYNSLTKKGLNQTGHHTMLYGSLKGKNNAVRCEGVEICRLARDEFPLFGQIYTEGFGMPAFLRDHVAVNNEVLYELDNWTFLIARADGCPAGIAVLYTDGQWANLASAATLPAFRNRGMQAALIDARMELARDKGCIWMAGQAAYGSASMRNMERAGMQIAYTSSIWS